MRGAVRVFVKVKSQEKGDKRRGVLGEAALLEIDIVHAQEADANHQSSRIRLERIKDI